MLQFLSFLALLLSAQALNGTSSCHCLNGGECPPTHFRSECECPPLMIGKYCETQGQELKEMGHYITITNNFSHFLFQPG